jgi:hypothetical protein
MLRNRFPFAIFMCVFAVQSVITVNAQSQDTPDLTALGGNLKLRGIGPALMGGRIADIAVSPTDRSTWFVAAGSGNLWKTTNSGITWTPVFDDLPSYSIGCVTIDPQNAQTIWVGTGENASGRHVGWGDGVYRSRDGGKSWEQMGLETSEHIGKILVDPRNSKIVLVAAEGPLWSSGGERGVFRTEDGGESWKLTNIPELLIATSTRLTRTSCMPRLINDGATSGLCSREDRVPGSTNQPITAPAGVR